MMTDLESFLRHLEQSGYTRMPGGHLRSIKYYTNLSPMTYLYEDSSDGRVGIIVTINIVGEFTWESQYLQMRFDDSGQFTKMVRGN